MRTSQLLSLAWRESRFARRRLFLFLSAISLGVAALVAVQGFAANMRAEIGNQARAMLGADVALRSREPIRRVVETVFDSLRTAGYDVARVTSFASMALHPGTGATRLVQVRAPEPGFPFYGSIETTPAGEWARLHDGRNAIVDPSLLVALGAEIGDSLSIGGAMFRITGALEKVPGDIEVASSFAPRVFLPAAAVSGSNLLGVGSIVDYEAFIRIPDPTVAKAFVEERSELWRGQRIRARTLEDQQQAIEEALGRMSDFLGLTGIFALLLGGIGVASAMSAYMARKVDNVAVLRCLGATARQVFGVYVVQAALMGLAGALAGVLLGGAVQWVLPRLLEGFLPVDVPIRLDGVAVVTGISVGVWTAIVFAVLPLLQVRTVSPLSALRRRVEPLRVPASDPVRLAAWLMLGGSVVFLIVRQAGQPLVGSIVAGAIGATLLVLWISAAAASRLLRTVPRGSFPYTLRQGIANLYRPGNQTTTVVLALGFGVFLIATLLLTQANVLRPLSIDSETRGNLLFFDVQEDQVDGVEQVLAREGVRVVHAAPIVPMRIAAINDVRVERRSGSRDASPFDEFEDAAADGAPRGWAVRREYRSTYRDTLQTSETLVEGRWWEPGREGTREVYEVSLDQDVAAELGVGIGDRIDWDVQGVEVPTRVTSLRAVDWARLEPNFYAVFEPAALRRAPQMWVFLARADEADARAAVLRDVVERYPNIAALDLTLIQRALDDVIGRISLVIRFLAGFSVATGFIVLLGAVASSRLQRIRESVLLKTLGATRSQIGAILLVEYALLGLLAFLVGASLAMGAGWGLARFLFGVPFVVDALPMLGLAVAISALSAAIGLSASREVFRSTPMEAIREE